RHRVDDETATGPERVHGGVKETRIAGAAADEDSIRPGEPIEGRRRPALDDLERRHAERRGVAADARRPLAARIDGSASIHSIATDPAPAPTSQSNSPRRGHNADNVMARISRLVIWPSCS